MFLGFSWHWWVILIVLLAISLPFKVKFMKWWSQRQKEKQSTQRDKWGDEE